MRSRDFKRIARQSLKGNWFVAIISAFIASLLGATGGFTITVNVESQEFEEGVTAILPLAGEMGSSGVGVVFPILSGVFIASAIYAIIQFIIGSGVGVGYAQFNLDIIDGCETRIGTLFSRFSQIKTAIAAKILIFIRVFFGFIFFIIPGIMALYSYSMVNFVMADNPDLNAREALRESKRIMKGYRWNLFCLELSFFGLILISVLTLGIGFIWTIPYMQATYAAFYREIA